MWVISKKTLREFWEMHPQAHKPLLAWFKIVKTAEWTSIAEVRKTYPSADGVVIHCPGGSKVTATVFNVKSHRIITLIKYPNIVYVKCVLTHAQYDTNQWKNDLCR